MNIGSAPTICGSSIKGPSVVGVSATGFGLRPPPFTDTPTTDSHLDCRYARILSVAAHLGAARTEGITHGFRNAHRFEIAMLAVFPNLVAELFYG